MLLIVADGQVDNQATNIKAIVEASNYPISIVVIGVGDGPWDMMKKFDDGLHSEGRRFDNFQFVDFDAVTRNAKSPDAALSLHALMEVPGN